jgi:hypothetical protein
MDTDKLAHSTLSDIAQRLASVLSCVLEIHDADMRDPHAVDCRAVRPPSPDQALHRDSERCQLCADLKSADELLARIDFDA